MPHSNENLRDVLLEVIPEMVASIAECQALLKEILSVLKKEKP